MMLATITDLKPQITLIQNSGIQFLDFALTPALDNQLPGAFVRQTANGPLLRLDYNVQNGKYMLPGNAGDTPEVVKPEFRFTLSQSLTLLSGIWLPLPFFRVNPPRTFIGGPDNWARVQIIALDKPDTNGNTHRVCLAFETRVWAEGEDKSLALNESDVKNGIRFVFVHHSNDLGEFLDQTWIDGWLRELFIQRATDVEQRPQGALSKALREFEYQAHYLNILHMLAHQLSLPALKICAATLQEPAIPVDLILDVGHTHSSGIMVEEHAGSHHGLKHSYTLHLRDLSAPQREYNPRFTSRVEFALASFGKQNYSVESGREDAFIWPSITRVGDEAYHLARQRLTTEGITGIASPLRYIWDEERYTPGWRFGHAPGNTLHQPLAAAAPVTNLVNDDGQPLYNQPLDERLPVFSPQYSRSAVISFMLSELLAQALMQINSVAQRQKMLCSSAPRQLRRIILTLPCAMPKPEQEIFRHRMHDAIALIWKGMGWHPTDDDFTSDSDKAKSTVPVPEIQLVWDQATCGQMVYLYNETQINFGGHAEAFFSTMVRPHRLHTTDESTGNTLRIASIDIGGGTTDLAIAQYRLDDSVGNNVKIVPRLLFREGFNQAGDDILLAIIQRYVMPALKSAFRLAGMVNPENLMTRLFGDQDGLDAQSSLRQQLALQLFIPIGLAILDAYEKYDPLELKAEVDARFDELLAQPPSRELLDSINREIQRALPADAEEFNILRIPLVVKLSDLHAGFLSAHSNISHILRSLADVVAAHDCDILLLTGRPSRLPGIKALFRQLQPVPVNRIFSLDVDHSNNGYPFNKQGCLNNPQSMAAVGAMLCLLSLDLRLGNFCFKASDLQPYSTIRYLGMLDNNCRLSRDNLWYSDIDLDDEKFGLNIHQCFQVGGPLTLGFRQLDNDHWPASPLYQLSMTDPLLLRHLAGDHLLKIRLTLTNEYAAKGSHHFAIFDATLDDGTPVPLEYLRLKLNTLACSSTGLSQYWIDSGSLYK